ncbi:MAG: hypothetical protein K9N47_21095 [Prosthecobacter sp.]|uniref:hypothetical protein n=1 Tax=Prosthecobacter sp. TaxID=1965333 RepID=UPI00262BC72E|nr:hypothetical protein [Prosthecobacter sp.]MCF7788633.1 hypothetical protein [Prosthecobacter sp.]
MITLTPRPLSELSDLQAVQKEDRRARHALMELKRPGLLAELRKQLADYECVHGTGDERMKRLREGELATANAAYTAKHGTPRVDLRPPEEFEPDHVIRWVPFHGHGRYSPDRRWHIAWGKCGNDQYRVAVSCGGELRAWLEPSARIVAGWVADGGLLCVKDFSGGDEVTFVFADLEGNVFHHWTRPLKFLRFLRFDADGLGFAFYDDQRTHEVRFEA